MSGFCLSHVIPDSYDQHRLVSKTDRCGKCRLAVNDDKASRGIAWADQDQPALRAAMRLPVPLG
ncbi:hypothetical protein D1012_21630 [Pseudotabrizicola alkalilacus]|uniref:Uncharacterized protein n=1 Tax=Pseudotabrizicola alkalilacus TaxID=2305252 RepID=A0A411YWL0_9RHOB|nr:hypothetical protein D1012_21630 [Pseudotabrizicola alkalilacus]